MAIRDICEKNVLTVPKDTSITEAAKLMKKHNVGNVVIVENNTNIKNHPIGILTDRDIVLKIVADEENANQISVADAITNEPFLLKGHQSINEALEMMCAKAVRRAPIVDNYDQVIGIVSTDDLLILMAEELSTLAKLIHKQTANVNH